jgi:hypothetical protein
MPHLVSRDNQRIHAAWRALELVIGLVKHAETKSVAALATAGVLGEVLFVLLRASTTKAGAVLWVCAGVCAGCVVGAGICAGCALWPKFGSRGSTANLLYFNHATSHYGFTRDRYVRALAELTGDPDALIDQLAEQVWENAAVARRKFRYANLAIGWLLAAMVSLAGAACLSLLNR